MHQCSCASLVLAFHAPPFFRSDFFFTPPLPHPHPSVIPLLALSSHAQVRLCEKKTAFTPYSHSSAVVPAPRMYEGTPTFADLGLSEGTIAMLGRLPSLLYPHPPSPPSSPSPSPLLLHFLSHHLHARSTAALLHDYAPPYLHIFSLRAECALLSLSLSRLHLLTATAFSLSQKALACHMPWPHKSRRLQQNLRPPRVMSPQPPRNASWKATGIR